MRRIVETLPQPALDGFKYIVTGETEELRALFGGRTAPKSFPLVEFDLEHSAILFAQTVKDLPTLNDLHNACSGIPAQLSSARRLIDRGANLSQLTQNVLRSGVFDIEWAAQDRKDDYGKKLLACLAFNDRRSTAADLASPVNLSTNAIRERVAGLSFLTIDQDGAIRFRARSFRKRAQAELHHLRRSVHKSIANRLLEQSGGSDRLLDLPLHYSESDDYGKVIDYLSPDHVVELIQKAQSINRVQGAVQLGLAAARNLDREGDLFRFGLDSTVLNEFFHFGYAVSEVSALSALGEYDPALAIARSAVLKEDRLHLLAIVARHKIQKYGPIEPEVLQQLSVLASEIDPLPLGNRLADILAELSAVLPNVALDLAEKAAPGGGG